LSLTLIWEMHIWPGKKSGNPAGVDFIKLNFHDFKQNILIHSITRFGTELAYSIL